MFRAKRWFPLGDRSFLLRDGSRVTFRFRSLPAWHTEVLVGGRVLIPDLFPHLKWIFAASLLVGTTIGIWLASTASPFQWG